VRAAWNFCWRRPRRFIGVRGQESGVSNESISTVGPTALPVRSLHWSLTPDP
jgi:hypothetical protein